MPARAQDFGESAANRRDWPRPSIGNNRMCSYWTNQLHTAVDRLTVSALCLHFLMARDEPATIFRNQLLGFEEKFYIL
jgi:hypothetical protein